MTSSHGQRNDKILYYDCSNYYFEIEQKDGSKKYGKSKEHRPNPIIQMGLFMDGDGIPLAFSLFPVNVNEQTSLKPLEKKVLSGFGCQKFIYCSDAELGSESIREFNHMGERTYIVTQSIKKLKKEEMWKLFTEIEMPLVFTLFHMEQNGVRVEAEELKSYGEQLGGKIVQLEKEIYELAGEEFNINSPKQLGVVLFEHLSLPNGRRRKQDIRRQQTYWISWHRIIQSWQKSWNIVSLPS